MRLFRRDTRHPIEKAIDRLKITSDMPETEIKIRLQGIIPIYYGKDSKGNPKRDDFLTFIKLIHRKFGPKLLNFTYEKYSYSLMRYAMIRGDYETVKKLISYGCDPRNKVPLGGKPEREWLSHIKIGLISTEQGDMAGLMRYCGERLYSKEEKETQLKKWVADYQRSATPENVSKMEETYQALCANGPIRLKPLSRDALIFQGLMKESTTPGVSNPLVCQEQEAAI